MNYAVGHNMPGYLPESDVWITSSWEDAKAYLIEELAFAADNIGAWADEHDCDDIPCPTHGDECPWQEASTLSLEAEDLNLSNGPEWSTIVGNTSWWITLTEESPEDESWDQS